MNGMVSCQSGNVISTAGKNPGFPDREKSFEMTEYRWNDTLFCALMAWSSLKMKILFWSMKRIATGYNSTGSKRKSGDERYLHRQPAWIPGWSVCG